MQIDEIEDNLSMKSFLNLELLYKRREPTEIKIDRLFEKLSDQINQPTKAQTDSKEESEFTATSFQTVTHSAKTQQTRKGNVLYEVSTNINTYINTILGGGISMFIGPQKQKV